ncbi:MAG: DUF1080 domain-containing protein [Anaerolineae bacterium]|nr:DUF1080 domain-containing protein [Anaerolineae bacterium]
MKRFIPLLIILLALIAGCAPAQDDAALMPTMIAQQLSAFPTNTIDPLSIPTLTLPPTLTPMEIDTLTPEPSQTPENTETPVLADTVTPTPEDTTTPEPSLTPTPGGVASDPRNQLGAPTKYDPLDNATEWGWPVGSDSFTSLSFKDGSMLMTGVTDLAGWRLPVQDGTTNFYLEVTASPQTCASTDNYGIMFRIPDYKNAIKGYQLMVSCDGRFTLRRWDGSVEPDGKANILVAWRAADAINKGADAVNRVGVMAVGNRIRVYINGVFLQEVLDDTFDTGNFALMVNPDVTEKFTVRYDEISIWTNPVLTP